MIDDSNSIEHLPWDSDFFNIAVGLIDLTKTQNRNLKAWEQLIFESGYDLVYLLADMKYSIEEIEYSIPGAMWVDGKTTFVKELDSTYNYEYPHIHSVCQVSEALYDIAIQTGVFSRFHLDKRFKLGDYERLYRTWLENSISRAICEEVFVWREESKELGLITLGEKNRRMDIGLIGVNKNSRGKGIATQLMQKAQIYARQRGFSEIQVLTQKKNLPAINLYEKLGFHQESLINVFHLWR